MPTKGWFYGFLEPSDKWFGEDKVQHFGWAAAVYAHGFLHGGALRGWVEVATAAILVELVEAVRYQFWAKRGFPEPWPWMTDKISPKDLLVAVLGVLAFQAFT
jgi:hypothetical protein